MAVGSPYPDIEIPDVDVWSLLFARPSRAYPDSQTLLIDPGLAAGGGEREGQQYSYAHVRSRSIRLGRGLRTEIGWKKGDVMGVFAPNSIDTPVITWAVLWAGGVVSPANPAYTVDELAFQLKDSGARSLVTRKSIEGIAIEAAAKAGIKPEMVFVMGDDRSSRCRHIDELTSPASGAVADGPAVSIQPDRDLAFLVYSSGTTGHPKGVMLSHRNIVANVLQVTVGEKSKMRWDGDLDGSGDKALGFLPLFHIYGLVVVLLAGVYQGIPLVLMPRFDLEKFCANIQRYRVGAAHIVPPVVLLLSKHPIVDKYDMSSLRMLNSGAAPLTSELVEAVRARLGVPVKQGYGLSETSPTTHVQTWDDHGEAVGSVGKLLPNLQVKLLDPEGNDVVPGTPGELWLRGPNVFLGYLNKPDLTADVFGPDRFFRTGDVGYIDPKGNFFITDRAKELIKYKGFQVPPAELEGLLVSHPDINDAAVIGVYDPNQATELPRAYIVLAPEQAGIVTKDESKRKAKADDISSWLSKRVAPHKRIRGGIVFVDQIPKSPSGKILRRLLRDQFEAEKRRAGSAKL